LQISFRGGIVVTGKPANTLLVVISFLVGEYLSLES